MNTIFQAVDLSDLTITDGFNPAYARVSHDVIECGDLVSYTDDNGAIAYGFYETLWAYEHNGEASPWINDNRYMAYVRTLDGGTDFADVTTIEKLVSSIETMKV